MVTCLTDTQGATMTGEQGETIGGATGSQSETGEQGEITKDVPEFPSEDPSNAIVLSDSGIVVSTAAPSSHRPELQRPVREPQFDLLRDLQLSDWAKAAEGNKKYSIFHTSFTLSGRLPPERVDDGNPPIDMHTAFQAQWRQFITGVPDQDPDKPHGFDQAPSGKMEDRILLVALGSLGPV